jgi:hypothetical protein
MAVERQRLQLAPGFSTVFRFGPLAKFPDHPQTAPFGVQAE